MQLVKLVTHLPPLVVTKVRVPRGAGLWGPRLWIVFGPPVLTLTPPLIPANVYYIGKKKTSEPYLSTPLVISPKQPAQLSLAWTPQL